MRPSVRLCRRVLALLLLFVAAGHGAAQQSERALVLRPGDVIGNAPIAVLRPVAAEVTRIRVAPAVGVVRPKPPPPAIERVLQAPLLSVHRGALVELLSPDTVEAGMSGQVVQVLGTGLQQVASARIDPPLGITVHLVDPAADGTSVQLQLDVAQDAVAGLRAFHLLDGSGRPVPASGPAAAQLMVATPQPVIDSVMPSLLAPGSEAILTIRGRHLRGLPVQDRFQAMEQPRVLLLPGDGIAVGAVATSNDAGTLVTVPIQVAADAPSLAHVVQVRTRSGASSAAPDPANTLQIADGPLVERGPLVAPQVGVLRPRASAINRDAHAPVVGVVRGAAILSFDPPSAQTGDQLELTLLGRGFTGATGVALMPPDGVDIEDGSLAITDEEVRVNLQVAAEASLQPRRLLLQRPGGTLEAPALFRIRSPEPEVTAISPTYLVRDAQNQVLAIQGRHLSQTVGATVLPDAGIIVDDYTVLDSGHAHVTLRAAEGAQTGPRVLRVSTPSAQSPAEPTPGNTFYVIDRQQILAPFSAPVLGVVRPHAPATATVGLFAPVVGVARGPFADGRSPALLPRGGVSTVEVTGRGLAGVVAAAVRDDAGLVVGNVVHGADGTSLSLEVAVAADAMSGIRRLELATASGLIEFIPGDAALLTIDDNDPSVPEAGPDSYEAVANGALHVPTAEGVLANDSSADGTPLIAVLRTLPAHGLLSLRADGSFSYTPASDFVGVDRFRYSPAAGDAMGAAVDVTLTVAEIDDAVDDAYATGDNQVLEVAPEDGLLANDLLGTGEVLIELQSVPGLGQLQLAADGSFVYLPAGPAGVDTFTYRLVRDDARSLPAEVRIQVQAVNEAPLAQDDHFIADRGVALVVPGASGVLANDLDPDGDPLVARVAVSPGVGALALSSDGGFTYTPPAEFTGEVSFSYDAVDPAGSWSRAVASIIVNAGLAARPDAYHLNEGELLLVDAVDGLLANDSLFPRGELRVLLETPPAEGTLQLADDGSFVYTPSDPDFHGADTFSYRLEDDFVTSNVAMVTLQVAPVNDTPEPADDRWLIDENADLVVAGPGLLANDLDRDGDNLTASLLVPPQHGTAIVQASGAFSYVPQVNFRGVDSFEYLATDPAGDSGVGTVRIEVTQPPTATNDVYMVDVDTPLAILDPEQGLLANDHDAPEHDPLLALLAEQPENGTLLLREDGTFDYTPPPGFVGLDVFTYQVTDTRSESNVATVTLAVGITSLPRAVPDSYVAEEDRELVVAADEGVLVNDLDADTPHGELEAYLVGRAYRNGVPLDVTVHRDGGFRVRPWNDFSGETFFVYQVFDGTDISNAAIVTIDVQLSNDGVVAEDDAFGVLRNTVFQSSAAGRSSIRFNDTYDNDFDVAFEIVEAPASGVADMVPATGQFTYAPAQDFSGVDSFVYRVWQVDTGIDDTATVVLRTNGPPVATPDAYVAIEDSAPVEVEPGLLDNDFDPDGDPVRLLQHEQVHDWRRWVVVRSEELEAPTTTTVRTAGNFYGRATIVYRITDGTGNGQAEITVDVAGLPDDPVAAPEQYLTGLGVPLSVNDPRDGVLANDYDPDTRPSASEAPWAAAQGVDLLPLGAELVAGAANGELDLLPSGTFYYVPAPGFSGTDHFSYRAVDATGRSSGIVEVAIRVNSPPIAQDDAYVTSEDVILDVDADQGVLINDTDPDGDGLSARFAHSGCAPCNGSVSVRSSGGFRYTPDRDFHGQDEFFYTARDGVAGSDAARVTITVLPVNDPPITDDDTYRTSEDEVLVVQEPQGVLRNDREVDGEPLVSSMLVSPPAHGSIDYQPDGAFTYVPGVDFHGRDTFRYSVADASGLSAEADVEVLVTAVNDAPVPQDDAYELLQDTELEVAASEGVLANDHDVDGPGLIASLVGLPAHGVLSLSSDGGFRYGPDAGWSGVDGFDYQVDDGLGALAVAHVVLQVSPVESEVEVTAQSDFYRFVGPVLSADAPGVLANDHVSGGALLQATLTVAPAHGTVHLAADGGFLYQAPPEFHGMDGFSYAAQAEGVSSIARVTLDVQRSANVPPVAEGEQFTTLEDALLSSRHTRSLLANDSDHEGAPLEVLVRMLPVHGQLTLLEEGHFTYQPAADFAGTDSFQYVVSDGVNESSPVTCELLVLAQNDAPVAVTDSYHLLPDSVLSVPVEDGVLANDHDSDADPLLVDLVDAPHFGQLQMDPAGAFTYTPLPGFRGDDSFRYAASDLAALSVARVDLSVAAANHAPVAIDDSYPMDEDSVLDSAVVGSLIANDSDPDGDTVLVSIATLPAEGELELVGNEGHFRYRPRANWSGEDAFTYLLSDGQLAAGPATVRILVRPVDDPPLAQVDRYVVLRGQVLELAAEDGVLANDSDAEGAALTVQLEHPPAYATVELFPDGAFLYQTIGDFLGQDEFAYLASDGTSEALGRVLVDVVAVANARPEALGERIHLEEDTVFDSRDFVHPLDNDVDPDGDPLYVVPGPAPPRGELFWADDGHLRYVPPLDLAGAVHIPYRVSDGELLSTPVELVLDFLPRNDPPLARDDTYYLPPASAELRQSPGSGVLANDADPDGDALAALVHVPPAHGQLWLALDGGFRYLPDEPRAARDSFRYMARDGAGEQMEAGVLLLMDPADAPEELFSDGFEQAGAR